MSSDASLKAAKKEVANANNEANKTAAFVASTISILATLNFPVGFTADSPTLAKFTSPIHAL